MRDLTNLPAERILQITAPEALFSRSKSEADAEYKSLVRRWHPDLEDEAIGVRVFAHVVQLHKQAIRKMNDHCWNEPCDKIEHQVSGRVRFKKRDGSITEITYTISHPFELGVMYISDSHIAFEVYEEFSDLMRVCRSRISHLPYKNSSMAEAISIYLPQIIDSFRTNTSSHVLVVRKTPDQISLADVLRHEGGGLTTVEHAGWIINILLNISCYLEWAGITHNAILAETFFVSPLRHSGMLLGGWWYSARSGERLRALPEQSIRIFPRDILLHKEADRRGDYESIKSILCNLLGYPAESDLTKNIMVPAPMREFLLMPSRGSAVDDYAFWKYKVLPEVFGPPQFIRWKLTSQDIYREK